MAAPCAAQRGRAGPQASDGSATPPPVLRLRHLLNVLEKNPDYQQRRAAAVRRLLARHRRSAGLFSDYGFGPRMALYSEIWDRLRLRVLPTTPDTRELAELFPLLFEPEDAQWLAAIDDATLQRLGRRPGAALGGGPTLARRRCWTR